MRKINYSMAVFAAFAMLATFSSTMTSCGGKAESENSDTTKKDTAAAYTIAPELQALIAKFKEYQEWPYKADTALLNRESNEIGDSLASADVAMLNVNWMKHDLLSSVEWEIGDYNKIDSIKVAGKYNEYCEGMEPGETKTANVYAINKLFVNEDTWILVWALRNGSYEACPYSNTTNIFATTVYKGTISESFMLAEKTVAGDPPVHMDSEATSVLEKDGTLIINTELEESEDGEELSTTKNRYAFKLVNGKWEKGKEEKGKPVITKIPQEY